jgi:hypothetical protein
MGRSESWFGRYLYLFLDGENVFKDEEKWTHGWGWVDSWMRRSGFMDGEKRIQGLGKWIHGWEKRI